MKGFTLIEILVVIALSVVLILVGTSMFMASNRFYQNQRGEIASVNATREAADRVNEYARGAAAIVASRAFSGTTYASGATAVVLELPSVDLSGNLIAGSNDYIAWGRDPGNSSRLMLAIDGAPGSIRTDRTLEVSNRLSAIALSYDNADPTLAKQVVYTLTVTETGRSPGSEQVHGSATLRN